MISRISLLIFTTLAWSARANSSGNSCDVRLNSHVPVFHQGSSLMCSSYSTAQVLSSTAREAVSPVWVSLMSGTVGSQQPTEAMNSMRRQSHLCKHDSALEPKADSVLNFHKTFEQEGLSLKKQLLPILSLKPGSSLYKSVSRRAEREGFDSTSEYINSLKAVRVNKFKSKISSLFFKTFSFKGRFSPSVSQFNEKINSFVSSLLSDDLNIYSKAVEFSVLGYSRYCFSNRIRSKFTNSNLRRLRFSDQSGDSCKLATSAIDESLKKRIPPIVGLNFETLYSKASATRGSGHYLTVVGKRCSESGEPSYLIRNSYGRSCGSHDGSSKKIAWPCDSKTGEFWIPASKICQNAGDVYTSHSTEAGGVETSTAHPLE